MLRKQIYSVLVLLGIVVSVSNAQTLPGYMRFQAAGWTFAPAISQGSVAGFLAWPGEAEPIGNNIKVMWFQRVNGEWQSYGWDGDTIGKAALYVRGEMADSTVFSKDTTVNQALSSSIDAVQLPRRVVKGLFEEDPFQSIVDQSPRSNALAGCARGCGVANRAISFNAGRSRRRMQRCSGLRANHFAGRSCT